MADDPGTCHLVGCPSKGMYDGHARQPGCTNQCVGTWPGGQPFHIRGCVNDQSRLPEPPAKVLLDQADVVALLDAHYGSPGYSGSRDIAHRVSKALAVARNTRATGSGTDGGPS